MSKNDEKEPDYANETKEERKNRRRRERRRVRDAQKDLARAKGRDKIMADRAKARLERALIDNASSQRAEVERRKAKMLAAEQVTLKTMLGQPEDSDLTKLSRNKKLTITILERFAELNFDPLDQAVKIAQGKALKEDHPFLQDFKDQVFWFIQQLEEFEEIEISDMHKFLQEGTRALSEVHTPIEIRSRHTLELLQYLYPKRKAMELKVEDVRPPMEVSPLTEEEVEIFNAKFLERY